MGNSTSFDTIYQYKGEIWYNKRGEINIKYRENTILEFQINKDGEINIDAHYTINGKFSDENNVSFNKRTGGMGGGSREEVIGIKE